jgi:hypothetical protein
MPSTFLKGAKPDQWICMLPVCVCPGGIQMFERTIISEAKVEFSNGLRGSGLHPNDSGFIQMIDKILCFTT